MMAIEAKAHPGEEQQYDKQTEEEEGDVIVGVAVRIMSEAAEDTEPRRVVAQFRHRIPAKMNKDDGEVLLTLLYTIGMLTKYLDTVARPKEDKESDDDESVESIAGEIEFYDYFDFDFEEDVELDSEGRITVLDICRSATTYNLSPIIERLQKLQRIQLPNCKLIPIELGNLPLLTSITFQCCDRALFENIPEGLVLSALKQVTISTYKRSCPSLSPFWKILPDTLEELIVNCINREQSDEILCALQNHDFGFRNSLTKIEVYN